MVFGVVHVVMTCPNGMSLLVIGAHNALGLIAARAINARDFNMMDNYSVLNGNRLCDYNDVDARCAQQEGLGLFIVNGTRPTKQTRTWIIPAEYDSSIYH